MDDQQNGRYLVILADRQKAKFFTIFMGSFEGEVEQLFDEVPQKVKAEHTRTGKVQRHINEHLHQHLKHVGQKANDFLIKRKIKNLTGVVIGSHQELMHSIEKYLPKRLQDKVIEEFVLDLDQPLSDITEKINQNIKEILDSPKPKERSSPSQTQMIR